MLKNDELSELKGQFLASLNHEIRTPLSGILGMSDLLLETPLTEEQKEYVDATRLCAENLLEILNATLEYSALSANHIHLEEEEYPLRETLEGVVAQFAFKAKSKGLQLSHTFDGNFPEAVIGDALRLRQLVWHLVANAVKFTNKGEVEVRASLNRLERGRAELEVQVRDTGIGIPASHVSAIFESFRQLETGLSRNYPGLGLGLAVAQKLAVLLKGEIAVESEPGRGSIFRVRLPIRLPADVHVRPVDFQRVRGHVLVVDDDSVAQTIASHVLRRHLYDVECVCNGPAAIDKASRATFDLILLDLQMPGMDGFQTARYIRAIPAYADTPIIAVTANCSSDYRDRCIKTGMQGFLAKPVQSKELVQTVERYLAGRTSLAS
ncbi:MAG TPA: response regulator [Bryobacteraceae bacterium]|nr:response regulator [Bryobacteraceae bacterium]